MIHDVISAKYLGEYRIELTFDDGKTGTIDFVEYQNLGGVFERFRDLEFFRNFKVDPELGVLTWEGGVDVAPETLYAEATGSPLPDWMTPHEPPPAEWREVFALGDRQTKRLGLTEADVEEAIRAVRSQKRR
jgi:hypothetical protein